MQKNSTDGEKLRGQRVLVWTVIIECIILLIMLIVFAGWIYKVPEVKIKRGEGVHTSSYKNAG